MIKIVKKTSLLMLCVVLVLVCFTACNKSEGEVAADPYAAYPEKSLTLVVPYAAGGESDTIARPIAQYMKNAGYTVVVQNITGASGNIGVMEVYNAKPDGYTFILHMPESMEIYAQGGDLPAHPLDMMKMVANVVLDSGVINVAPDSKFKTFEEVIEYGKAHPGELKVASTGTMGYNQVSVESLYGDLGVEITYVPYESASKAKAAIMGGHADVYHCYLSSAVHAAKNGEVRPVAIGAKERFHLLPDVPTLVEMGHDLTWGFHRCFMVPKDTPDEIVAKMEEAIQAAFDDENVIKTYSDLNLNAYWLDSEGLTKEIEEILPKVGKAYKDLMAKQ